jgi:putative ABC transport system permease protein
VAAQVGLSLVLLIGAALMVRSLIRLLAVDPGFRPERVLTATLDLPFSKYPAGPQIAGFYRRLLQDLSGAPGVVSAAASSDVPMGDANFLTPSYRVDGQPTPPGQPAPRADLHVASEEYFRTLGIPLLEGRAFTMHDDQPAPPVVIVNRTLARHWWPGRSAIGQRIAVDLARQDLSAWRTVVGVVADVRHEGLTEESRPTLYAPYLQLPGAASQVFVRTRTEPAAFLADLRSTVAAIDREQPVSNVATLDQVYSTALAPARLTAVLLSLFAALALAITGIGIGAAVSFAVGERIQEMAIRMALGADGGSVLSLLFRRAMGPVVVGLVLGLAAALAVLLGIGTVTCLLPARRASRIDPASTLRS